MLSSIQETIDLLRHNFNTENEFRNDSYFCEDFEATNKVIETARISQQSLIEKLVDQINEYIDYPVTKFLFFKFGKRASYRPEYNPFDGRFCAYILSVPPIHKGEYYCVRKVLLSDKNIVNLTRSDYYIFRM